MTRALGSSFIADAIRRGTAIQLVDNFPLQSYFDSTLLSAAIIPSSANGNGIASSTLRNRPHEGIGIALLPTSQAPLAIVPTMESGASAGAAVVLKPGEVYYPGAPFKALQYGLPFGWLGGGLVHLLILRENFGDVLFTGNPEVVIQRQRMPVRAPASNPASIAPNWPLTFPWLNAINNLGGSQPGAAVFSVTPTRIALRLRSAPPGAGGVLRLFSWATDDFDAQNTALDVASTYDALGTSASILDVAFPSVTASAFQVGGVTVAEFPLVMYTANALRCGGPSAVVALVDIGSVYANAYVDIVRYGVL
jgi:hypothetical protein